MALIGLSVQVCLAENPAKVTLDTNETLFTVLTAINACGYDQELGVSDPLRAQIRSEVAKAIQAKPENKDLTRNMCQFYEEHQQADSSRTLAQYISLTLYLNGPPGPFVTKVKEADLPPDAAYVLGMVPLVQKFYDQVGIHAIWERHQEAYAGLTERYHAPLSKMLFDTEIYLKLPSAGYLGRGFFIYIDPMGAPGQSNARNYGSDYFVVISPGAGASLKVEQMRHTYLHYLLDPYALKYPTAMKRLEPLLLTTRTAPMDDSFKGDISLLVTECLIRAIEARTLGSGKSADVQREQAVEASMEQGFILTRFFYERLIVFEKDPAGLRDSYGQMLVDIDVSKEAKRVAQIQFATKADPELLHLSRPLEGKLLVTAEKRLSAGDTESAQKLAQQALDEKSEDAGRALFILAQVSTVNGDMDGARTYFQKALEVAQEPKVVAWSHIYLGRIYDLQEDRPAALDQYRAALTSGASLPEVEAAAQRGLQQAYEPPHQSQ